MVLLSSFRIFKSYLRITEKGAIDPSLLISWECYTVYLSNKKSEDDQSQRKCFVRALKAHLSGGGTALTFSPEEERAILIHLRQPSNWPQYLQDISSFRILGHHEKRFLQLRPRENALRECASFGGYKEVASQSSNEFLTTMTHGVNLFLLSMEENEYTWQALCDHLRFLLLARHIRRVPLTDVETAHVFQTFCHAYPYAGVVAGNFFQSGQAWNDVVAQVFGSANGIQVPKENALATVVAISNSFEQPGLRFEVMIKLATTGGETELFKVVYCVEEKSFLLAYALSKW
jgi:hypothetical protein